MIAWLRKFPRMHVKFSSQQPRRRKTARNAVNVHVRTTYASAEHLDLMNTGTLTGTRRLSGIIMLRTRRQWPQAAATDAAAIGIIIDSQSTPRTRRRHNQQPPQGSAAIVLDVKRYNYFARKLVSRVKIRQVYTAGGYRDFDETKSTSLRSLLYTSDARWSLAEILQAYHQA